jgi:hypothetical protein
MAIENEHPFARMFRRWPNDTQFTGRSADEVVAEQEAIGTSVRRWNEDHDDRGVWTLDFRSGGRLNLWVRGGKVVSAAWF